jgi:hypothetical protein
LLQNHISPSNLTACAPNDLERNGILKRFFAPVGAILGGRK